MSGDWACRHGINSAVSANTLRMPLNQRRWANHYGLGRIHIDFDGSSLGHSIRGHACTKAARLTCLEARSPRSTALASVRVRF